MLLLVSTHQAVVAALKDQIAFLERQLSETQRDRDFYREHFTKEKVGATLKPYQTREEIAAIDAEAATSAARAKRQQVKEFAQSLAGSDSLIIQDWAKAQGHQGDPFDAYVSAFGPVHPAYVLAE